MQEPEAHPEAGDRNAFGGEFMALMGRIITFPVPTICAVNGHAFWSWIHVGTLPRRTYHACRSRLLCANEMQLGMRIPSQSWLCSDIRCPAVHFRNGAVGETLAAPAALEAGIVQQVADIEDLLAAAQAKAQELAPLGANRKNYGGQKETLMAKTQQLMARMDRPTCCVTLTNMAIRARALVSKEHKLAGKQSSHARYDAPQNVVLFRAMRRISCCCNSRRIDVYHVTFDLFEAFVNLFKAFVDLLETFLYQLKALLKLLEAFR
ncbi:MAG: hypothetical protein CM15mP120_00280 [Pseudomonadota bacterium]|nr:MAG: hypothetical protein CM15mP120_00280 [Pseudomonadota bacterium]